MKSKANVYRWLRISVCSSFIMLRIISAQCHGCLSAKKDATTRVIAPRDE